MHETDEEVGQQDKKENSNGSGKETQIIREVREKHAEKVKKMKAEHHMLVEELAKKINARKEFRATVVKYNDLTDDHMNDMDLCISMGGTNTFLKAAMHIKDP